jgi:hypothetical protein
MENRNLTDHHTQAVLVGPAVNIIDDQLVGYCELCDTRFVDGRWLIGITYADDTARNFELEVEILHIAMELAPFAKVTFYHEGRAVPALTESTSVDDFMYAEPLTAHAGGLYDDDGSKVDIAVQLRERAAGVGHWLHETDIGLYDWIEARRAKEFLRPILSQR